MSFRKKKLKLFLCYSHRDRAAVQDLYNRLSHDGFQPWFDRETLQPGQDWEHTIQTAILESDVVLVCLSRHFNRQGGYRHTEVRMSLEKAAALHENQVFVIPVRLEACRLPAALAHLQRADLFDETGYKNLVTALRRLWRRR